MTPSLFSLRLVTSDLMVEQFRFPKTKKRRIRNKWAKRPENWRPMRRAMIMGDMVLVHPSLAARIRRDEMLMGNAYFHADLS